MKTKIKYLIFILLLLVGISFTTYAIYRVTKTGSASVSAAKWIVKINANNNTINVTGTSQVVNLGLCPSLAPGSTCEIPFTIDMTESEVDSILTVNIGNDVEGATLEQLNSAGIKLKISDGVSEGYAYRLNYATSKNLSLVIDWEAGSEDDNVKAAADIVISKLLNEIIIPVNVIVRQYKNIDRTITFNTHDTNIPSPNSIQVRDGESVVNIPSLSKEGYVFVGWYTDFVDGVKLTNTTPIVSDIEYHARFKVARNITISFDSNGGSNVDSEIVLEESTMTTIPEPTKTGYTFNGWYDENNELLTTSTVLSYEKEYSASWSPNTYKITLSSGSGVTTSGTGSIYETYDTKYSLSNNGTAMTTNSNRITIPVKTNYNFLGYFTASSGGVKYIDENGYITNNASNNNFSAPGTLYAHWSKTYTVGEVVYFNPVNGGSTNSCSSVTGNCMKFNVLKDNGDTVLLQLDHNIVNKVAWASSGSNTSGAVTANSELATAVSSWNNVQIIKNEENQNVKARMITYDEIKAISGVLENSNGLSKLPAWMLQNTTSYSSSGATSNTYSANVHGYWTSTKKSTDKAYFTYEDGTVKANEKVSRATYFGVRPIISVLKSKL